MEFALDYFKFLSYANEIVVSFKHSLSHIVVSFNLFISFSIYIKF